MELAAQSLANSMLGVSGVSGSYFSEYLDNYDVNPAQHDRNRAADTMRYFVICCYWPETRAKVHTEL